MAKAVWILAGLAAASSAYAAGITVEPADGPVSLAGFTLDLDCDDLVVNGTLDITGSTFQKVGNVIIGAGGSLTATDANIEMTSSWQNNGSFSGAGSSVTASNACANTSSSFSGNTTFHNFSATSSGMTLSFAGGTEQQVAGLLTLNNVTLQGQGTTTFLSLLPGGTQNITTVGVGNVNASRGQRLAPTQMNQIGQGYAPNWFANPSSIPSGIAPVPTTSAFGLSLLGLLLSGAAFWKRRAKKNKSF
ncbi:MAG: IPTL-CTERM sorting domain-containing protein [Comamonadaceae bacterium]|nr:IPTL-CTERM sorting domain-containing protein [Comamonadaceae bacterium]